MWGEEGIVPLIVGITFVVDSVNGVFGSFQAGNIFEIVCITRCSEANDNLIRQMKKVSARTLQSR